MRRGNIFLLPTPPVITEDPAKWPEHAKALTLHLQQMHTILNQAMQSFQGRLNTIQQINAKEPPNVSGFTVTPKQGLFHLTWNVIRNVDGYVIMQASDAAMVNIVGRYHVSDGNQCSFQIPVGNVAVTASFQIYAYQGTAYGDPSPIITATTIVYGSTESVPPFPPFTPQVPKKFPVRSGPNLP